MKNIIRQKLATQGLCVRPASPEVRVVFFITRLVAGFSPVSSGEPVFIERQ